MGLYRDNGKSNGNYYILGLYRGLYRRLLKGILREILGV